MSRPNVDVADLDRRFLWHPFTQMRDWMSGEPLVIESAEGNHLIDAQGREVGRLLGPAEWDGEDAKKLIASVLK